LGLEVRYFSNVEQCCEVMESYLDEFSSDGSKMLRKALEIDCLTDEAKVSYILSRFRTMLYDKPEALRMGFSAWMDINFAERIEAIKYFGENCEGKRPRIYK